MTTPIRRRRKSNIDEEVDSLEDDTPSPRTEARIMDQQANQSFQNFMMMQAERDEKRQEREEISRREDRRLQMEENRRIREENRQSRDQMHTKCLTLGLHSQ